MYKAARLYTRVSWANGTAHEASTPRTPRVTYPRHDVSILSCAIWAAFWLLAIAGCAFIVYIISAAA